MGISLAEVLWRVITTAVMPSLRCSAGWYRGPREHLLRNCMMRWPARTMPLGRARYTPLFLECGLERVPFLRQQRYGLDRACYFDHAPRFDRFVDGDEGVEHVVAELT